MLRVWIVKRYVMNLPIFLNLKGSLFLNVALKVE